MDGGGDFWFRDLAGREYRLLTTTADPEISNQGDGAFHPPSGADVREALEAIESDLSGLHVEIFLLPFPRSGVLTSSADARAIYLSPGVREYTATELASIVTHEMGHVVQANRFPDGSARWNAYLALRGIADASRYAPGGLHRDRPHEIFAEDFRFLFGGRGARAAGTIENPALALPTEVAGLRALLEEGIAAFDGNGGTRGTNPRVAVGVFPNPFNPTTTIRLARTASAAAAPDAADAVVHVFDASGRVVRTLFQGRVSGSVVFFTWDGRDEGGVAVASGVYFLRASIGGETLRAKLILAR